MYKGSCRKLGSVVSFDVATRTDYTYRKTRWWLGTYHGKNGKAPGWNVQITAFSSFKYMYLHNVQMVIRPLRVEFNVFYDGDD